MSVEQKKSSQLSCGIVGLPNVGKSTFFNALTKQMAASENYPFCTIDPNVGVVSVEDSRLQKLSVLSKSKKVIPATIHFVDIAGLVKGASTGEGLGNQFLANIRETDMIIHLVRCFQSEKVIHVHGNVAPIEDIEVINLELILADLQMLENIYAKREKQAKTSPLAKEELVVLQKAKEHLNDNLPLRTLEISKEEKVILHTFPFLTLKKVIYVANVSEDDLPSMHNEFVEQVKEYAQKEQSVVIPICARIEEELAQFQEEEAKEFLSSLGLQESGLNRIIRAAFQNLGLISFITTGEIETRAWSIPKGTKAKEAAGKIHTDIMNKFTRAEVISFEDMVTYNGRVGAKEAGKARLEGKDYEVQDGDVILFYHH